MDEVEKLIQQLEDPDVKVRRNAVERLIKIGKPAVPGLIEALQDEVDHRTRFRNMMVTGVLVKIGEPAVLPVIDKLEDKSGAVRWRAAGALRQIGDARAVPALIGALEDEKFGVRANAVEALGEIKDEKAVLPLIERLGDESIDVRGNAVRALFKIGESAVIPFLDRFWVENAFVRVRVVEALGKIKDERVVSPLIERLGDESIDVQKEAARALVKLSDKTEIDLSKVDGSLRRYAERVKRSGTAEEREKARDWVAKTYRQIADAVSESKKKEMPGELLEGRIKPPKKGMYRMRRAANG